MPQETTALPKLLPPEVTCLQGLRFISNTLRNNKTDSSIVDEINTAVLHITTLNVKRASTIHVNEFNRLLGEYDRLATETGDNVNHLPTFMATAKKIADGDNDSDDDTEEKITDIAFYLNAFDEQAGRLDRIESQLFKKIQDFFEGGNNTPHHVQQNYDVIEKTLHDALKKIHNIQKEKKISLSNHGLDTLHEHIIQNIKAVLDAFKAIQEKIKTTQKQLCQCVNKTPPTSPTVSVHSSSSTTSFSSDISGSTETGPGPEPGPEHTTRKRPRSPTAPFFSDTRKGSSRSRSTSAESSTAENKPNI